MAGSTVSAVLRRIGLGKLSRLEPPEPPNRYERASPGELIHIDVKKLVRIETRRRAPGDRQAHLAGKGAGWERVHVCVDDATRLAYVEVLGDEKARTAIGFLRRALAFYAAHGITVERLMTDNGPPTARSPTRSPAGRWGSATSAPGPTGPAPTARQSASSARCWVAGPMERSIATPRSGPRPYPAGLTSITGADRTALSVIGRPELGSPS